MITSSPERIAELTRRGDWGEQTLHGLLAEQARDRGQQLAVKDQPDREEWTGLPALSLSWHELDLASDVLAQLLQARGVRADDRLLLQMPNIAELLVSYYAASKLGAIVSPVPVQYGAHELRHISAVLQPRALLTVPRYKNLALAEQASSILDGVEVWQFGRELSVDSGEVDVTPTVELATNANAIVTICWTSGTTGTPKGVPRSHNMWLATARLTAAASEYEAEDRLLNPFPLVNMAALGGFLYPSALLGCSLLLHHPFNPPLFLNQLQEDRITFTIVPPAVLNQLAKQPEIWHKYDYSALRAIGSGSAPLAPWMVETFDQQYGKKIVNLYGSNEGISLFSTPRTAPSAEVRATMFPLPDGPDTLLQTRVVDPASGEEIHAPGQAGELLVAGATVFDGYFPADAQPVFSSDGFFHTGDLVEICGEGPAYYRIVGRCKDIINRGGMKISPSEIDLCLVGLPGVIEAAVCAYPDQRLGEKICACLVLQEERPAPTLEELQDYLSAQGLASFKLPERIHLLSMLPRNPMGKVQRFALNELMSDDIDSQEQSA